jgi:hypothetical protein
MSYTVFVICAGCIENDGAGLQQTTYFTDSILGTGESWFHFTQRMGATMNDKKQRSAPDATQTATQNAPDVAGASRYEKYAATQAAGNGVEGDVQKKDKTDAEKLGTQMTDRR